MSQATWKKGSSVNTGNPGSLCVSCTAGFHNMGKYREHMMQSLGLEICWKMEIEIYEI